MIIPNTVDANAILIVSTMPIHAVEQVKSKRGYTVQTGYAWGSITLQSGGQSDSLMNMIRLPGPSDSLPQSSTMLLTRSSDNTKVATRVPMIRCFVNLKY